MPSWNQYKTISKERGSLAFELFCVQTQPAKDPEEIQKHLSAHLAYQKELENKGVLFMAGPLSDESGETMSGAGLIIYRANSLKEAQDIAAEDPMHKAGARTFTIKAWLVNEGNMTFNLQFAAQTARIV